MAHVIDMDKVWANVTIDPDGCWRYHGFINNKGYGSFYKKYVHRLSYEYWVGPIPDGLVIDHLCFVPNCCNPDHLEAVTQHENCKRVRQPDKCPKGHQDWAYRDNKTHRYCAECNRIRSRAGHQRRKKAKAEWPTD